MPAPRLTRASTFPFQRPAAQEPPQEPWHFSAACFTAPNPLTVVALNPSQPQEKVSITVFSWREEW